MLFTSYKVLLAVNSVILGLALAGALASTFRALDIRKTILRENIALWCAFCGFAVEIALFFYWFVLMQLCVLGCPGTRCIMGVLEKAGSVSGLECVLRLIIVCAALYYLFIRHLDKKLSARPFRRYKITLIFVIVPLVAAARFFDLALTSRIQGIINDAYGTVFTLHVGTPVLRVSSFPYFWMVCFLVFIALVVALLVLTNTFSYDFFHARFSRKAVALRTGLGASAAGALVSYLLALHNECCPLYLDLPNHFCMFCALDVSLTMLLSFSMVLVGLSVAAAAALVPALPPNGEPSTGREIGFFNTFHNWIVSAILLIAGGAALSAVSVIAAFIK